VTAVLSLAASEIFLLSTVLLAGAFIRGYSGFGFSAVLMAGFGLVLTPAEIVPIAVSLEVLASLGQFWQVRKEVDYRGLWTIVATGVLGTPLGVWLLIYLPAEPLQIAVYAWIGLSSAILLAGPVRVIKLSWPVVAGAGFLAGIVNGATALSGLVLALMFNLSGTTPAVMRATLVTYFFVTDLWAGVLLTSVGSFDLVTLSRIGAALPLMAVGLALGSRHFVRTAPESFRSMTLSLLIALCVIGLCSI
jgi:uncharacterized membrane protein YfcA